ncbi:hypothetical protein PLICRDRAFT_35076 [Plicaturopsis crispa FD-325 SS-3]|nr:hypothetical protein PLICRDRAFT_35076 [Plicaturopsis crispa FD-325 SS-3]
MAHTFSDERAKSIGILGAGAAGLITAHTLLHDGFTDVHVLTRDSGPGGVWAPSRVYPGLKINNVHGEFRFSPMSMPAGRAGSRLTGEDMSAYMQAFAARFVDGRASVHYDTEILNIRRASGGGWAVSVSDKTTARSVMRFDRLVLCTGGCSTPSIPPALAPGAEKFLGLVVHSSQFGGHLDDFAALQNTRDAHAPASVVVVGGGKSAQDISSYLTNRGLQVSMVFDRADAFLASPFPLPGFVRKSRLLGILSPHMDLHTRLERFLHTTWLGGKIVRAFWSTLTFLAYSAMKMPATSPLRRAHSVFWSIRVNDEDPRADGFFALANMGRIALVSPARVAGYGADRRSVVLEDGRVLAADAVVLATGYASSWAGIFDDDTAQELGLSRHPPTTSETWKYTSLQDPPPAHPHSEQWAASIYRGIVPSKNLARRDFAINGAVFTTNNGYTFEVCAHWISAYFLRDALRLPASPAEAVANAARCAAWARVRYPDMLLWTNESYSSGLSFFTWPQTVDTLLEDMGLLSMRSGGNWLTWPFQVVDAGEIATLAAERAAMRGRV